MARDWRRTRLEENENDGNGLDEKWIRQLDIILQALDTS